MTFRTRNAETKNCKTCVKTAFLMLFTYPLKKVSGNRMRTC